jgi:uridine kinase
VDAGNYNFDDPAALDLNRLADDLAQLKAGCAVRTPVYDFTLHRRAPALRELAPRALVVVEGLFLFVPPALRAVFDLRCFVDVPAAERLRRRLQRDTRERGRSEQDVLRQWRDQVEPMYERHALPTRAHADLVLTLPSADPAACAAQTAAVFALVDERLRRSIVAG